MDNAKKEAWVCGGYLLPRRREKDQEIRKLSPR